MAATRRSGVQLMVILMVAAAGYLVGLQRGQVATMRALQAEAAGNLSQRIEVLSLLRTDASLAAISRLEEEADQLAVSMGANATPNRDALVQAKAYRSAVPPPPARERELAAVFATVPDPKPSECSSALQKLLAKRSQPQSDR